MHDIIVAGDLIADETQHVVVTGPTTENANVIGVTEGALEITPGGAGNVALNCAALGKTVIFMASIGRHMDDQDLRSAFYRGKVSPDLLTCSTRTRARRRVVSPDGMLIRLNRNTVCDKSHLRNLPQYMEEDPSPQILVLSDYDGGYLTNGREPSTDLRMVLHEACSRHMSILVDPPRNGKWYEFRSGQTIFKPNIRQALAYMRKTTPFDNPDFHHGWDVNDTSAVVPRDAAVLFARHLAQALEADGVINKGLWITLGPGGSVVFNTERDVATYYPVLEPVEVRDVTGAGDTAMAVMAVVLAIDAPFEHGVKLANIAGSIAVQKRGCWKANWDEIITAIHRIYAGKECAGSFRDDGAFLLNTACRCAGKEKK